MSEGMASSCVDPILGQFTQQGSFGQLPERRGCAAGNPGGWRKKRPVEVVLVRLPMILFMVVASQPGERGTQHHVMRLPACQWT